MEILFDDESLDELLARLRAIVEDDNNPADLRLAAMYEAAETYYLQQQPFPEWLWGRIFGPISQVVYLHHGSLDEAFGRKSITSKRLRQKQQAMENAIKVRRVVEALESEGFSLDWLAIGDEVGVSESQARKLYYGDVDGLYLIEHLFPRGINRRK